MMIFEFYLGTPMKCLD